MPPQKAKAACNPVGSGCGGENNNHGGNSTAPIVHDGQAVCNG
jgi:hypothetical protein